MNPAQIILSFFQLLTNPELDAAVLDTAQRAIALGFKVRDRLTREGSFQHQDALDALNLDFELRFKTIETAKTSGAMTQAQAEEATRVTMLDYTQQLQRLVP